METKQNSTGVIILIIVILLLCLLCLCVIAVATGIIALNLDLFPLNLGKTPVAYSPTSPTWPTPIPPTNATNDEIELPTIEVKELSKENLETLKNEIVPINDPIDLAERLAGKNEIPDTYPDPHQPYQVGDTKSFWISDTDTNENFQINAILRYLGDNIYFWIQEGVKFDSQELKDLAEEFDDQIYPTNREFFGSEWKPGVDNDPHIYVLYAGGLGNSLAGYYSSADELHPAAHPYSNAHEMFLISSDNVNLGDEYIYGTMAHEFQHMIHWHNDRNEDTWLNEGFSMLAELLNEYDTGGFDFLYIMNTDLQLTDWSGDIGDNGPHYGASFLFTTYFLDRFGENATKALVSHKENGLSSLDLVSKEMNLINPDTGNPYNGNEFFADWAVTNYLLDRTIDNGRYDYNSYSPTSAEETDIISTCPEKKVRDVYQFGVNYLEYDCKGEYTINFKGVEQVAVLDMDNDHSGEFFFWSNMGDDSNSRLTAEFDLSSAQIPITLEYKTWYDLEDGYDYVFLSASTDNKTWEILNTTSCTTKNPSGNSYGCGYTDRSNGWIDEKVDLSEFAGKKITLRFDYVTDAAVNGTGLAIDDVAIKAINYSNDFEKDDGGWEGEGFVRIQNILPQTYNLSLIEFGNQPKVTHITLSEDNTASIQIKIGSEVKKVVLVVSGTTPITKERAIYQVEIK